MLGGHFFQEKIIINGINGVFAFKKRFNSMISRKGGNSKLTLKKGETKLFHRYWVFLPIRQSEKKEEIF